MLLPAGEKYFEGWTAASQPRPFHRHDSRKRGHLFASAAAAAEACVPDPTGTLQLRIFHSLIRASDYRGSDVRLDAGELLRPHAFPRRSLDPGKWAWYTALAHRFNDEEHINILELRAALTALKWRTRSARRLRTRFLHMVDSQVALAVLVKGRSRSWRLNRVLRQVGAVTLAGGLLPSYAYVRSE